MGDSGAGEQGAEARVKHLLEGWMTPRYSATAASSYECAPVKSAIFMHAAATISSREMRRFVCRSSEVVRKSSGMVWLAVGGNTILVSRTQKLNRNSVRSQPDSQPDFPTGIRLVNTL